MYENMIKIDLSVEAIKEARKTIIDILNTNHEETIREALNALVNICHVTIANCVFNGEAKNSINQSES